MNTLTDRVNELLPYLIQHGSHTLAYSTLQSDVDHFVVPGVGYIAFKDFGLIRKQAFVLSDPICAKEDRAKLLEEFLKEHPHSSFFQIDQDTGKILHEHGFYVNEFGIETDINIPTFKTSGNSMEFVRRQYKAAKNAGVQTLELPSNQVDVSMLERISQEWIGSRFASNKKEMSFLARPAVFGDEPGVRKFYEFIGDTLIGFAWFSPMYQDGKVVGYYLDIHRHINEEPNDKKKGSQGTTIEEIKAKGIIGSPKGMSYFSTVEALSKFKQEGVQRLALGYSPFYGVEDSGDMHSPFTKWLFQTIYSKMDRLYHNSGNYFFKSRWRGQEKDVFFASRSKYPVLTVLELYKICNVF